jgi:hypothetical protein
MNDCLLSLKELIEIVKKLLGLTAVSHKPQFRDANTFPVKDVDVSAGHAHL